MRKQVGHHSIVNIGLSIGRFIADTDLNSRKRLFDSGQLRGFESTAVGQGFTQFAQQ